MAKLEYFLRAHIYDIITMASWLLGSCASYMFLRDVTAVLYVNYDRNAKPRRLYNRRRSICEKKDLTDLNDRSDFVNDAFEFCWM